MLKCSQDTTQSQVNIIPGPDNHHTFRGRTPLRLPEHFMRPLIAIVFVSLYLVALLRPLAPVLEYYSRQDYFATILCINKDKPQLHCNGQCVLKVKLRAAMKTESETSTTLPKVNFEDYPVAEILGTLTDLHSTFISFLKANAVFYQIYNSRCGSCLFHPPQHK